LSYTDTAIERIYH